MFNTPYALDATGTEFELEANRRVFDVTIYKPEQLYLTCGFKFTVTANSFE
jgi:hypothetical protein